MYQKKYFVTLTGATDLLLHKDNIDFGEKVRSWQKDPANREHSVAGDDRSPAWTWLGSLYVANKRLVMDADNIMAVLRDGGRRVSAGGKKTFKSQTQSGIICDEIGWPLMVKGHEIPSAPLFELLKEPDFAKHEEAARANDFWLFVKRAKINPKAKHVRVRPRFEGWSVSGHLTVVDDTLDAETLKTILKFAGSYAGLGDWRPGSPNSPGQFGRFTAEIREVK